MIHIVTAANDKYFNYAIAMIRSAYLNSSDKSLNFYIIYENLSSSNISLISKCFNSAEIKIVFLKIDKSKFSNVILSSYAKSSYEAYARILLPELINQIDKVIYLDADIVVLNDISKLYSLDISRYSIAAVRDFNPNSSAIFEKTFNIPKKGKRIHYFNSGVMLMNLKRLRQEKFTINALNFLNTTKINYLFFDQDIFNYFFYNSYYTLDPRWNVQLYLELTTSDYRHSTLNKHDYSNCLTSPFLIHFTIIKPDRVDYLFFKHRNSYIKYLESAGVKFSFAPTSLKDFFWTVSELVFFKIINTFSLASRSKLIKFVRSLSLNRI